MAEWGCVDRPNAQSQRLSPHSSGDAGEPQKAISPGAAIKILKEEFGSGAVVVGDGRSEGESWVRIMKDADVRDCRICIEGGFIQRVNDKIGRASCRERV